MIGRSPPRKNTLFGLVGNGCDFGQAKNVGSSDRSVPRGKHLRTGSGYVQNSQRKISLFQSPENGAECPNPKTNSKLNSMVSKSKLFYAQECHKHLLSIVSKKKPKISSSPIYSPISRSPSLTKNSKTSKNPKKSTKYSSNPKPRPPPPKTQNYPIPNPPRQPPPQTQPPSLNSTPPLCLNPTRLRRPTKIFFPSKIFF